MPNKPDLDAIGKQLERLRQDYLARLPAQLAELEQLTRGLADASDSYATLVTLHQQLHKLAGSAGSFGQPKLGVAARKLELILREAMKLGYLPPGENLLDRIVGLSGEIECCVEQDREHHSLASRELPGNYLWVLEPDPVRGRDLANELAPFNYRVRLFSEARQLIETATEQSSGYLLIDAALLELSTAEQPLLTWIERFQERGGQLIMISDCDTFACRVRAARLGALGFQIKPLDIPKLVARIQQGATTLGAAPGRVLIVEDDLDLAQHYRFALMRAGFEVELLERPDTLVETLLNFRPELVLMDLYMPTYSGPELAGVIRQYDKWASLPIVYLSAETDLGLQMQALSRGADDFLTKPVHEDRLVASVRSRIERARQLSDLIVRDSLTGLLKHATIKEVVEQELQRCRRVDQPLTLAMLDIDHFKSINDNYGHGVGDSVIAAVGTLLKQRLRQSDVVGRYGGEEFLAALPNCGLESALTLMDDLRRRFAQIQFSAEGKQFSGTLSVGLATTSDRPNLSREALMDEADKALYRAKHTGRNRVCDLTSALPKEV